MCVGGGGGGEGVGGMRGRESRRWRDGAFFANFPTRSMSFPVRTSA